jgi:hypothetical protein
MTSDLETGDYDGDPQATGRAAIYLQHKPLMPIANALVLSGRRFVRHFLCQ